MQVQAYGANHMEVARTLRNLGVLYADTGKHEEARVKFEEALEMQKQVYGADAKNADLAITLNNIGLLYGEMGRDEEAHAMFERANEMDSSFVVS